MDRSDLSGHIAIEGDSLAYDGPDGRGWRVRVDDLRLVGEYTTSDGPGVDDYFLVFLTSERRLEASFYAVGVESAVAELGRRLNHRLMPGLCNSVSLASRVLWPVDLEGQPLLQLLPARSTRSALSGLLQHLVPRARVRLSDDVLRAVRRGGAP